MTLSIIIVNWNVREYLLKLVESIFKYTQNIDFEIIVVDNASNDGSVAELRQQFFNQIKNQQLLIIENRQNQGFSKANNQGAKEARGQYLLFCNPDIEFIENSGLKLKEFLDSHPQACVVAPQLLYGDKSLQPNVKHHPTWLSQVIILLKLHHFFKFKSLNHYLAKDFDYDQEAEVEQVMGAFFLIRRFDFELLRGWNEDYWLWWEDVDLCFRLNKGGKKIFYTPNTQVIHYESKSFEKVATLAKQKRFIRSLLKYFKNHGTKFEYYSLFIFIPLSLLLAYITQLFKIKPRTQSQF